MKKPADFKTKKEFFEYLAKNKADIILFKKSAIKHTDPLFISDDCIVGKTAMTNFKDDLSTGIIKRTVIGNTYNWMDCQNDVLLSGCFAKSISEKSAESIWHLHDHMRMITAKVGKPVSFSEKTYTWKDLGVDIEGKTEALTMDTNIIKDYNAATYQGYLNKEIQQHSVGMRYVQIDLAVNDPEMKAEYAQWNKYINSIGNKDAVMKDGYFWAVKEGILIEVSAVLAGANEITPTLDNESKSLSYEEAVAKVEAELMGLTKEKFDEQIKKFQSLKSDKSDPKLKGILNFANIAKHL